MKNLIVLKITKSLCAVFLILAFLVCANPLALYAEELSETEETTSAEETTTETTSEETTTTETTSEETTTTETTSETTTTEESLNPIAEGEEPTGQVAAENVADPEDGYNIYKYIINIEYGTLSFYYDWGVWDTDHCVYTAEKSSYGPSKETQDNTAQLRNQLQGQLQNVTAENQPNSPGWYGFDGTANKISVTNLSAGNESIYVRLDYNYETDEFNTSETFPPIVQPTVTYYFDEAMSISCETLDETGNYQIMQIPYSEDPNNIYVSLAGAPYYADDMTGKPTAERYHANTATQIGFLTITVGVSEESLLPSPSQTFSWHDEEEDPGLIEPTVTEETTSAEETTTTETTSTEETTTAETTSAEETTTTETTSAEETTTTETTSAEETTTAETTSAEETTTTETTSAEETTTTETTSAEETTTAETTSAEETTTAETTSAEETTTQEPILTE